MMKIQITGYSSSGKSTFAKKLSSFYNIPLLHIDTIYFQKNWEKRPKELVLKELNQFIQKEQWIIDGQYRYLAPERYEIADQIFIFDFNRFKCLYGAIKRRFHYRNKQRDSVAKGCKERLSLDFIFWILFNGRKKESKDLLKNLKKTYPEKVVVFKKRKHVYTYLKKLGFYEQ